MDKIKKRELTPEFIKDLKDVNGKLNQIFKVVKSDDTLCPCIRNNAIIVYYRGGKLFEIKEQNKVYKITFNEAYIVEHGLWPMPNFNNLNAINDYIAMIPLAKREIDYRRPQPEKEFQQLIVRENNYSNIATGTDYYITDIEYANAEFGCRLDLLGVKWPSTTPSRKNKTSLKLAIMEMKYGNNAVAGSSGIVEHFEDLLNFVNDSSKMSELYVETQGVMNQLLDLELYKGIEGKKGVEVSKEKAEYILILANYKKSSSVLRRELDKAVNAFPELLRLMDVKIANASYMGYGLYDDRLIDVKNYINGKLENL